MRIVWQLTRARHLEAIDVYQCQHGRFVGDPPRLAAPNEQDQTGREREVNLETVDAERENHTRRAWREGGGGRGREREGERREGRWRGEEGRTLSASTPRDTTAERDLSSEGTLFSSLSVYRGSITVSPGSFLPRSRQIISPKSTDNLPRSRQICTAHPCQRENRLTTNASEAPCGHHRLCVPTRVGWAARYAPHRGWSSQTYNTIQAEREICTLRPSTPSETTSASQPCATTPATAV